MTCYFVGGAQRSGTGVLANILCADETTHRRTREVDYLRFLISAYRWGKRQFSSQTYDFFDNLDDLREFHSGVVGAFLERTRKRLGTRRLVLKEPQLTKYSPELRNAGKLCDRFLESYLPVFNGRASFGAARLLWVKYEDLVTAPSEGIEKIRRFTGLALSRLNLNEGFDNGLDPQQLPERLKPWVTDLYWKPISPESVGRYREILADSEIAEIEKKCQKFMIRFGYSRG
ncbi:MAG: hypothetical protein HYU77_08575 [Betaproteobacteria bacterium]|nr:hypothetical protein [Betaproteobacteria bacterium]